MMMGLKRSFTLLEMMIALVILSIIGALIVLQVKKLVDVHRFEGNVADLFIALQEAQALSATYQTDIALDIFLEKGIPTYRFTTDEPFPPNQFKQQPVALGNTSRVEFNGTKATALHLDIYSGGRIEPRGSLAFQHIEGGSRTIWFDLQRGQLLKFSYRKPVLVKQQIPIRPEESGQPS